MSRLFDVLGNAAADLAALRVRYALVGGLAVSCHVEPRFTRDIDIAVALQDDAAAESLVGRLTARGYRVVALAEQEATGRLATVRLVPPGEDEAGVIVDLLFASSGWEPDLVARAEPIEVAAALVIPVALPVDLAALKVLARDDARRPQDRVDLLALASRLDGEGRAAVRDEIADADRSA